MNKKKFYTNVSKQSLNEIIDELRTPCYLFSKKILGQQISKLKSCTKGNFKINYALKANPNPDILKELAAAGVGADVASGGELLAALSNGIPASEIEFSGPGKRIEELTQAIESGVGSINIENLDEIDHILLICNQKTLTANIGIRINPEFIDGRTGMKMAGDTQFGLTIPQVKKAMQKIESSRSCLVFSGFHAHLASQELNAQILVDNMRLVIKVVIDLMDGSLLKLRKINFGGGWGIRYFPNQQDLDLDLMCNLLDELIQSNDYKALPKDIELNIEPGRFISGESGVFATRVLYRKMSKTKEFLITDGGMNANYLLAGGMGQVIRRNFEIDLLASETRDTIEPVKFDIAGPLCTPQDVIATKVDVNFDVKPGDIVLFFNCGAYGKSASPINFLGHDVPDEHLID